MRIEWLIAAGAGLYFLRKLSVGENSAAVGEKSPPITGNFSASGSYGGSVNVAEASSGESVSPVESAVSEKSAVKLPVMRPLNISPKVIGPEPTNFRGFKALDFNGGAR